MSNHHSIDFFRHQKIVRDEKRRKISYSFSTNVYGQMLNAGGRGLQLAGCGRGFDLAEGAIDLFGQVSARVISYLPRAELIKKETRQISLTGR